jgi:hypothetical protein
MKKIGKKRAKEQSAAGQQRFPFRGLARESLLDAVILSGFGFVQDELDAERTALCGERYAHQAQRDAVRAGHVPSSLGLGRPARGDSTSAGAQHRWSRTELAELAGVERARSAQ